MRASQKFMQGTIFTLLLVLTGMAPSTTTRAQTAGASVGASVGDYAVELPEPQLPAPAPAPLPAPAPALHRAMSLSILIPTRIP